MTFKKNTAVTGFVVGLTSATDGSDITTGTPVGYYTLDGGVQTAIGDVTPVHEGNGMWSVDLTAAEMNGDIVGLTFTHASAITVHFTIKTDTKIVSDLNDIAATAIVSSGAITTSAGAVSSVTTVATTTTNTDMRGTDSAALATALATVDTNVDAILVDTAQIGVAGAGLTDLGGMSTAMKAEVNAEADTALTDYDGPTNAEMNARTLLAASYFDPTADTVANVTTVATTTTNTDMRGTDGANTTAPDNTSITAILVDTNDLQTNQGNWLTATGFALSSVATEARLSELDAGTGGKMANQVDLIKTDTSGIDDLAINKNTAFPNFEFLMVLTSDGRTPATGLTVTGQASKDGAAFTNVSGVIAEVSNGIYQFDALAADTNGDVITWRFSAATADDTFITFKTVA